MTHTFTLSISRVRHLPDPAIPEARLYPANSIMTPLSSLTFYYLGLLHLPI